MERETQSFGELEEIFHRAQELPAEERPAYLDRACGDDAELRGRLDELLEVRTLQLLPSSGPSSQDPDRARTGAGEPTMIGRYRIIEKVGEGGMGVVYRARSPEGQRDVALKVIKPGMDTREVLARFDAEKNALSLMDHPNIAHVYDSGETDDGRPYFVLEYVAGPSLTRYCQRERCSLENRLRIFSDICKGVQHAHSKAVVHRDLKPSNVLVTLVDGKPVAKIIDFGLAKALGARLTEKTLFSSNRQVLGTIEYMAPEQADGESTDVDTRTDVYSLGVILYELLVERRPFDLRRRAHDEVFRIIREDEPVRPSLRLSRLSHEETSRIAHDLRLVPHSLRSRLQRELDWIVLMALHKERDRRYPTPLELAADVERFLNGEAVHARPPSGAYLLRKFARRYRTALATVAVTLAALSGGLGWALVERGKAQANAIVAGKARDLADRRLEETRAAQMVEYATDLAERDSRASLEAALAAYEKHPGPHSLGAVVSALPAQRHLRVLRHQGFVEAILIAPGGDRFATISRTRTIIWTADGEWVAELAIPGSYIADASRDPAHRIFATVEYRKGAQTVTVIDFDGTIVAQWRVEGDPAADSGGPMVSDDGLPDTVSLRILPRTRRLLHTSVEGAIRIYDLEGNPIQTLAREASLSPRGAVSPDEQWIAAVDQEGRVRVWRWNGAEYGEWGEHEFTGGGLREVEFSPVAGDPTLVAGTVWWTLQQRPIESHGVVVLHIPSSAGPLEEERFIDVGPPGLFSVQFSPDGSRLLTSSEKSIAIHGVHEPWTQTLVRDHHARYCSAYFVPHSSSVVAQRMDGGIEILNDTGETRFSLRSLDASMGVLTLHPDGHHLIQGVRAGRVLLWDLEPAITPSIQLSQGGVRSLRFTSDRTELVTVDHRGLSFYGARDGVLKRRLTSLPDHPYLDVAVDPRGRRAVAVGSVGRAFAIDLLHDESTRLEEFRRRVLLAQAHYSVDGTLFVMSRTSLPLLEHGGQHYQLPYSIPAWDGQFSGDGQTLLLAGFSTREENGFYEVPVADFRPVVFDETGTPSWASNGPVAAVIQPHHPEKRLRCAVYSPDPQERSILTVGIGGSVDLWDRRDLDGPPVLSLHADGTARAHPNEVRAAAFSPSGELIGTAAADHTARIWRRSDGALLFTIRHHSPVVDIEFVDDELVWTLQEDGRLTAWIIDEDAAIAAAREFLAR